jgi:hypothetical protein
VIDEIRSTPRWATMVSVAHTFVYDCMISDATNSSLLRSVDVLTLVLDSEGSSENLTGWAATVARHLPRALHRSLAGEWHVVPNDVLASVLVEFFTGTLAGDTAPGQPHSPA